MRNLKKVLALTVAIVMCFSLSIVGLAGDYTKFKDVNDIKFPDAVALLTALDIISGKPVAGSTTETAFDGKANLTRAEVAKILYVINNNGIDDNATLYAKDACSLTDITGHWAEGYIKYCFKKTIVAGMGDNTYMPDEPVTGLQFMKMLLVGLGYDPLKEGYVGSSWAVNVGIGGQNADVKDGIESVDMTVAITRDDACQLLFNALFATEVHYVNGILEKRLGSDNHTPLTFARDALSLDVLEGILIANDKVSVDSNKHGNDDPGVCNTGKSIIYYEDSTSATAIPRYVEIGAVTPIELIGQSVNAYVKVKQGSATKVTKGTDVDKVFGNVVPTAGMNTVTYAVNNDYSKDNLSANSLFYVNFANSYTLNNTPYDFKVPTTLAAKTKMFDQYYAGISGTANGVSRLTGRDESSQATGQLVVMISNDGNKSVEYVLGYDKKFGEITSYSTSTTSLTINDSANYTNGFLNVKAADVFDYDSFKLHDMVLMWKTTEGNYVVEQAKSIEGTLSGTSGSANSLTANIDGTKYKVARDHIDPDDLLAVDFVGQKVTYYLDGERLCGVNATGVKKIAENYLVVRDSSAEGTWGKISKGEAFYATILTSTGSKKTYEIDSIYTNDGGSKLALTNAANAGAGTALGETPVYVTTTALRNTGIAGHGYGINDLVFKYNFTSDGKLLMYAPVFNDQSLTAKYEKGAANMSISTQGKKLVQPTTTVFVKNTNPTVNAWYVFNGRSSVPSLNQVGAGGVSGHLDKFSSKNDMLSAVALASTDFTGTASTEKYGFILNCEASANTDGTVYYKDLTLFDGEQIITYAGVNGVRAINSGLVKLTGVNIPETTVIKYTLDGGKIDTIEFVNSLTWNRSSAANNPDGFFTGYVAKATTDTVTVYQDSKTTTLPGNFSLDNGIFVLVYNGTEKEDWAVYSGTEAKKMINTQDAIEDRFLDGWHSYTFVGHDDDDDGALDWAVMLNDATDAVDKERYELPNSDALDTMLSANFAKTNTPGNDTFTAYDNTAGVSITASAIGNAAAVKVQITVPQITYLGKTVSYEPFVDASLQNVGIVVPAKVDSGTNSTFTFIYPATNPAAATGDIGLTVKYDGATVGTYRTAVTVVLNAAQLALIQNAATPVTALIAADTAALSTAAAAPFVANNTNALANTYLSGTGYTIKTKEVEEISAAAPAITLLTDINAGGSFTVTKAMLGTTDVTSKFTCTTVRNNTDPANVKNDLTIKSNASIGAGTLTFTLTYTGVLTQTIAGVTTTVPGFEINIPFSVVIPA